MKFAKIAKKDISGIFQNRFIRVSVVAIIIVPLLYSLLYLAAFWDPYSRMDKLPVAVVNLDKGANNDGKYENAGSKVVDELKSNKEVGWKFVNLEEAKKGLDHDGYYSMFVIPEDFSSKILSAKDGKPQEPKVKYIPNEKKNFLASQIGGKVADKLKEKMTASVVKQYTEATFDKLFEVKDGMLKASDGSKELADGNDKMLDGVTKLTDGIPTMQDGVSKLYDGSVQVKDGVGQLKSKVDTGMAKLNEKDLAKLLTSNNLKTAQGLIAKGEDFAKKPLPEVLNLINSNTVAFGNKAYGDVNGLLTSPELTKIASAPSISKILNMDLTKPQNQLALKNRIDSAKQLMNVVNDMQSKLPAFDQQIKNIGGLVGQAGELSKSAQTIKTNIEKDPNFKGLQASVNMKPEELQQQQAKIKGLMDGLDAWAKDPRLTEQQKQVLLGAKQTIAMQNSAIGSVGTLYKTYMPQVSQVATKADKLSTSMNNLSTKLPELMQQYDGMKKLLAANKENLDLMNDLIKSTDSMQVLMPKVTAVKTDLDQAKPMFDKLNTKENLALIQQSPELVSQLKQVQKDMVNNQDLIRIAKDNLTQGKLQEAQNLISSIPTVKAGVTKLYDGTVQLSGGLGTLNGKIPELADGANQLKDGATKLADGSKELSDKLNDGYTEMNDGLKNSSKEMGSFVSEPFSMNTEAINAVKDYGTGFTPYFIPLSLWVGAIMMFFVISPKVEDEMGAGPKSKVAGKYLSYGFIGLLQSVLVSAVVLTLGLKPNNIVMYFVFNILMSYTFIAIIQCLIFLLGDAGRLLAIVLLILQLTSCAGTFPLEVVPDLFKFLNPFMPFTYGVAGLREAISGTDMGVIAHSAFVLICIAIVSLIISMIFQEKGEKLQKMVEAKKEQVA